MCDVGIADAVIDELIGSFGIESVSESYWFAMHNMTNSIKSRSGFIIDCIRKQRKLSHNEKLKITEETVRKTELEKQKQQKENEASAIAEAEAERNEAERIATFSWWSMLTGQERQNYWELALVGLNAFAKKAIGNLVMPDDLVKLPTKDASIIVANLTQIRKEQNNEQNRTTT